jgi:hypothetical protein
MRTALSALLLPFAAWLGALQTLATNGGGVDDTVRFIGIAGVLGTLTVLIYRLGVWRQEMENTKHNIGAEVKAYHEESTVNFERLERRLDAIDHMVSMAADFRSVANKRQARTDRRLERLEQLHEEPAE